MKAKYNSQCDICHDPIGQGDEIRKWGNQYVHAFCRDEAHRSGEIDTGETFRSQRRSDYRRKIHHK